LARLRKRHQRWEGTRLAKGAAAVLTDLPSDTVEIRAAFQLGSAREVGLSFGHLSRGGRRMAVAYRHEEGRLSFAERSGAFRILPEEEDLELRIFLDRSVVEVYANGRVSLTAGLDCPGVGEEALRRERDAALTLFARDGEARALAVEIWEMASIWGEPA
jgi:beta-fructofuranosidase